MNIAHKKTKISIVHPSRCRAIVALNTCCLWILRTDKDTDLDIEYILSLDSDDPQLAQYKSLFSDAPASIKIEVNRNRNVVQAMNAGAKVATGDILVCISDDFLCPQYWERYITKHVNTSIEMALKVDDGITKADNVILTIPILTKKLYDRLGYIYFPSYTGIYADNDLAEACKAIGALRVNHDKLFEHVHWSAGKGQMDDTNRRHDNAEGWKLGEKLIEKRRAENFGLQKTTLLSVLLPTIPNRERDFIKLSNYLVSLAEKNNLSHLIEFKYDPRDKQTDIGTKRQEMIEDAAGQYVVMIDDDDLVPEYYFPEIIKAIEEKPDCIGFNIHCTFDGKNDKTAIASNRFEKWGDVTEGGRVTGYERTPFWCTPIRRELALKAGYTRGMRWNEDEDFSKRVKPLISSEVFIDKVMYFYRHSSKENHKTKYGIK